MEEIIRTIQSNPMVLSALLGGIGVALSGIVLYAIRDVPTKILGTLSNLVFATVTVKGNDWSKRELYARFLPVVSRYNIPLLYNSYTATTTWNVEEDKNTSKTGLGYGTHLLNINGALAKLTVQTIDGTDSYDMLTVTTMVWNRNKLRALLTEVVENKDPRVLSYELACEGWVRTGVHFSTKLSDMPLEPKFKKSLIKLVEDYVNRPTDSLFNRLTVLLHGAPGSGKTGLIRAIAMEYGFSTYSIDIVGLTNQSLVRIFSSIPKNSIILLEDCDCTESTTERVSSSGGENPTVTLGALLNRLDGISPIKDCMVFLTTNHLDKLDPALVRTARVDVMLEVPPVPADVVTDYLTSKYGAIPAVLSPKTGAEIYELEREIHYKFEGDKSDGEVYRYRHVS